MPAQALPRCSRCSRPTTKLHRLEVLKLGEADVALEDQDTGRAPLESAVAYDGQGPSTCDDCLTPFLTDAASLVAVRVLRADDQWTRLPERWIAELVIHGPGAPDDVDDCQKAAAGVIVVSAVTGAGQPKPD